MVKHYERPRLTFAERQAYQRIVADDIQEMMDAAHVSIYQVAKGSGVAYSVVTRVLKGCECKWWVICAINEYFMKMAQDAAEGL